MARLLALSLLAVSACATPSGAGAPPSSVSTSRVPDFELPTVDGDRVRLSDAVGKGVVVLAFWDTWCEPCKTEMGQLDRIYKARKAQGLTLLAIAMDDSTTVAQVAPYVKRKALSYPVLLDTASTAANLFNPTKTAPYTVVIDRSGKVVSEHAGYEPGEEVTLEQTIVTLLGGERAAP